MNINNSQIINNAYNYYEKENYQKIMSAIIQKQMDLLGHKLGLDKACNIIDLEVDERGKVLFYHGNPEQVIENLLKQYADLTGEATYYFSKKVVRDLMIMNKDLKMPLILKAYHPSGETYKQISNEEDYKP